LAPGARADLVWWDDDLRVRGVWIDGAPATATTPSPTSTATPRSS
jgi:hypothetical protein